MSLLLAALLALPCSAGTLEGDAARAGSMRGDSSGGPPAVGQGVELPARAPAKPDELPPPSDVTRAGVLEVLPHLAAQPVPEGFSLRTQNSAAMGEVEHYGALPAGRFAGSFGAGPCIGLLLRVPGKEAWAAHFSATDSPRALLKKATPPEGFPAGTRAALFGGDGSPDSDRTLAAVVRFLMANKDRVKIDGYADRADLYVDGEGRYYGLRTARKKSP